MKSLSLVVNIYWLTLLIVEVFVQLSWHVSVSGVIHVLDWCSVNVWFVEFIELFMSQFLVIFNTITIFIIDLSFLKWSVVSREAQLGEILWSVNAVLIVQKLS